MAARITHKITLTLDEEETVWVERESEETDLETMRDMMWGGYQAIMNALQDKQINA